MMKKNQGIKKKAKKYRAALRPQISLEEKIKNVYKGYKGHCGFDNILSKWFGNDISELANIANKWRNELAHAKHSFKPKEQVITSVNLIEHLNYAIVLREAGYQDEEISRILEIILQRWYAKNKKALNEAVKKIFNKK